MLQRFVEACVSQLTLQAYEYLTIVQCHWSLTHNHMAHEVASGIGEEDAFHRTQPFPSRVLDLGY